MKINYYYSKKKKLLTFYFNHIQKRFSLKIHIEVFYYGFLLQKPLEYLDIGNVAVLEVGSSTRVVLTTIVLVINRDKYDRLLNY